MLKISYLLSKVLVKMQVRIIEEIKVKHADKIRIIKISEYN